MTKFLPYECRQYSGIVFTLILGVATVLCACTSPENRDPQSITDKTAGNTTTDDLSVQIREIDSLCDVPHFDLVESRLTRLKDDEDTWSADLTPDEYAWAYDWIAEFHLRLGDLPAANRYIERAFSRYDSIQDRDLKGDLLNNRAIIESDMGHSDRAVELLFQGMELYGSDTINRAFVDFYNNVGIVYSRNREYDLAIQYYEKLMTLAEALQLEDEYGFYHANLGNTHIRMGNLQKGVAHLEQARSHFIHNGQTDEELYLSPLLASGYIALGDLRQAENVIQGNLEEAAAKKNWAAYVEITISLFELHVARGNEQAAFEIIGQGLDKIHITQTSRLKLKIFDKLIDYYRETGDFEKAFAYLLRQRDVQDSVSLASRAGFMRELTVRYETDRKNDLITHLQVLNENEQRIKRLYLIGLVVVILILTFIFILLRKIYKQKSALEEANQTKDTLFSIIAHDLRSPMIALQGMGDLMNYYIDKKDEAKLLELGDKTSQTLRRIHHLLDNLLNWAVSNRGQLVCRPVEKEVSELLEEVMAVHHAGAEAKEIHWQQDVQVATVFVDLNMAFSIFHNLLSNAVRHAPQGSVIQVTGQVEGAYYRIGITDEGGGVPQRVLDGLQRREQGVAPEGENGSFGLGLRLVQSFIEKHQGKLRIHRVDKGTRVEVSLPLRQDSRIK